MGISYLNQSLKKVNDSLKSAVAKVRLSSAYILGCEKKIQFGRPLIYNRNTKVL